MKFCTECGYSNQPGAGVCARCGFKFAGPPPLPSASAEPREGSNTLMLVILLIVAGTALGGRFVAGEIALRKLQARYAAELRRADKSRHEETQARIAEQEKAALAEETAHYEKMQNRALLSGELARARHGAEWEKRLARDPRYAHSALDHTLLAMAKVGSDPSVPAREALEKVARLAAPPGSRIEVTNAHDKFAVRVAFKLSKVTPGEAGTRTKHYSIASFRREVEEVSAHVMKEILDHCGARGIARLSVTCNRAIYQRGYIPEAATREERKELAKRGGVVMSRIYRLAIDEAQAAAVVNWRAVSVPRLLKLTRLEFDAIKNMEIRELTRETSADEDPDMPLEF